jgi:hypothetical protein
MATMRKNIFVIDSADRAFIQFSFAYKRRETENEKKLVDELLRISLCYSY